MKNDYVKSFVVLVAICIVVALLMGVVNYFTAPTIEENERIKTEAALKEVMPEGVGFEKVPMTGFPSTVKLVYKEANGGYVFKLVTNGYGTGLTIMCGIDKNGVITGCKCIESNETLGKEKTYGESFGGKNYAGAEAVDTISGATLTSRAYRKAILDAFKTFEALNSGE